MQILSLDVIEDWRFSDMINSPFRRVSVWLSGGTAKPEAKDRPLVRLHPVFVGPRTLVRTWGTPAELI
jgi:hypothetical protein